MYKLLFIALIAGLMLVSFTAGAARASEVDILIKKLVEKGILTKDEAQEIVAEIKEESKAEMAKEAPAKEAAVAAAAKEEEKDKIPQWVKNMTFKGDLRLRYQGEIRETDAHVRNRGRFRLRAGVDTKIVDNMNVAFGLASGGDGDPRSTNQTFQDSFSKKPVWIDYAYVKWNPMPELILTGGKIKNPFWLPVDNLWDADINPEGAALQANYNVMPDLNLFLNAGILVVDELGVDADDPWMIAVQPGFDWYFIPEKADAKFAFGWYELFNETGRIPDWSAGTNTRRTGDGVRYDFRPLTADGMISFRKPFADVAYLRDYIRYVGLFANGVVNLPAEEKLGGVIGFEFGDQKVSKLGEWKVSARYEYLAQDAWPDWLPDADAYYGGTNVKGTRVRLELGLLNNVWFTTTYYNNEHIVGPHIPQHIWQCDVNCKF